MFVLVCFVLFEKDFFCVVCKIVAQSLGINFGIYCNWYTWSTLFGSATLPNADSIPLWYPHYDGDPSFSDFQPFGGFTQPAIKQFSDKGGKCGASGYDINWSPTQIN